MVYPVYQPGRTNVQPTRIRTTVDLYSPMIMHRLSVLEHGTWGPDTWTEDWDLVQRWLDAGVKYVNVDAETSDVWPSVYR